MDDQTEPRLMARIPGQIIAGGSRMLPNPETDTEKFRDVRLDVRGVGIVRVTYEHRLYRHYKMQHRSWLAVSAEPLQKPDPAQV